MTPTTDKLSIKVFSPYQVFYEGTGVSLSAHNKTGPFDILYDHGNFFSLLKPGRIIVETGYERVEVEIEGGFIRVNNNRVVIFANV